MPPSRLNTIDGNERDYAARFGALVREHREALGLRQDDVALASGVGRRFVIELEAGKPTCQIGKALLVASVVGLRTFDLLTQSLADTALLPAANAAARPPGFSEDDLPAYQPPAEQIGQRT